MDARGGNFFLLNMPELVLENILSNIHNPSNVSRTCKYLYEVVCGIERCRRVIYIGPSDASVDKSPLNIDTDAVFESIMDSHRTIKEIKLLVDDQQYQLNEERLVRMTAIMKQFGANVTSLNFFECILPISFILELLQHTPKLETLSFTLGKETGYEPQNTTMSFQLPTLKALEVKDFPGLMDIINLIPAGSLNSLCYTNQGTESTEVLTTILAKQHNIKSLFLDYDQPAPCVDHLQLEALTFKWNRSDSISELVESLKCQMNLKELRIMQYFKLSGSLFQWICKNLKKLEVFEVHEVEPIEGNVFEMLSELKHLRQFRTYYADYLFANGFHSSHFKSDSIETFEITTLSELYSGERLNKFLISMAHNLPNLTHLQMRFENFSDLWFVLRHCTQIIHLTSYIDDLSPDQSTQQRFPNIQHLKVYNYFDGEKMMSQSMTVMAHAMPNLKSVSLVTPYGIKFDVKTIQEFISESKSLEYFYVDRFKSHQELSTDDVIETIRCLTDQLKGYHIIFSASPECLNWHKIKDILSNDFNVRYDSWKECIYLYKGGKGNSLTRF